MEIGGCVADIAIVLFLLGVIVYALRHLMLVDAYVAAVM